MTTKHVTVDALVLHCMINMHVLGHNYHIDYVLCMP